MSTLVRVFVCSVISLVALAEMGCYLPPHPLLRQSQLRARQLYGQNTSLAFQRNQLNQTLQALNTKNQQLTHRKNSLKSNLTIANRRLNNLSSERSNLHQRVISLLNNARTQRSPLSPTTTDRFRKLMKKYKNFEFDPHTGVSKFRADLVFTSGSAVIQKDARPLLRDFATIMNDSDAEQVYILVVGHTDDRQIGKRSTQSKHPTNWHLSTNRANSVVLALSEFGVQPNRMGVAGYSMYQPVVPNADSKSRSKNRRVEIFVLSPDAVVAGWDPRTTKN